MIAVKVQNVSKKFQIGKKSSGSLRETITNLLKFKKDNVNEFWALKDINFEVKSGDSFAIIGKNGAGKSTLLKILSQITPPTKGKIEINGKVASLLEVGTGFHPELTGRENIFLNGAILGMKTKEIKRKIDEIIDFSGIEKFIDTPVKRYSSGMYVRLAFAVAAHLEPEILIIDEVLAVGDAEFQRKCLGKMEEVATGGRTVLFVSHNISAINNLCNNAILLKDGKIICNGPVLEVTQYYMQNINIIQLEKKWNEDNGDDTITPISIRVINTNYQNISFISVNDKFGVEFTYKVEKKCNKLLPNFHFFTSYGDVAFITVCNKFNNHNTSGIYKTIAWVPSHFLNEGTYTIGVAIASIDPVILHFSDYEALTIEIVDDLAAITRAGYVGKINGAVRPLLDWDVYKLE